MKIKVGDLVVLTKTGKDFFGIPSNKLSPVFSILSLYNKETKCVNGFELNDPSKREKFLIPYHYRKATENEVKTYKLSNMFNGRRDQNGI